MHNMTAAFCGGTPLWDKDLLLNNTFPEFTECFRFSVLTSLPCGWLWLVTPVHVHYVMRHRLHRRVPSSLLNITKTIVCVVLALLSVAEGVLTARHTETTGAPPALYVSFVVRSVTFTLAAVLTKTSRSALIASPCVLFIFWFLTLVTSIVPVYHSVMRERDQLPEFLVLCVMFGLAVLQFFLNCWAEAVGSVTFDTTKGIDKECHRKKKVANPEVLASFPSKITFFWMNSLIYLGFKRALEPSDMWDLPPKYQSRNAIVKFQELFEKSCKTILHERKKASVLEINQNEDKLENGSIMNAKSMMMTTFPVHEGSLEASSSPKKTVPVFICLVKSFYFELFCSNLIRLFGDCLQFAFPALLGGLIKYIENKEELPPWHGYTFVAAFFVISFLVSVCHNQNFFRSNNIGMKMRTSLIATVYKKALRMSSESKRQYTTGAIVNHMSIDCQRIQAVATQMWVAVSAPVQISLAFYFLYNKLGLSFLVGVAIILVLIPVNCSLSLLTRKYQSEQLAHKDQRLKTMNEVLNGIKVIKLSAWEPSFQQVISHIRNAEITCMRKAAILSTFIIFNWVCSPVLVTTATLLTYSFVSEEQHLSPSTAFVSLSLFNILRQPMHSLPNCISELIQANVSLKRLREFLSCEELEILDGSSYSKEGVAISVKDASFTWERNEISTLQNINLEVKEGQLVAVVGPVGAGKSSLLSAILGEMQRLKGQVALKGSVAYVPQQAWIQNRTLKDSVIFDNKLDHKLYRDVIYACALKPDLDMLPGGDKVEIGEKGINLSGGQKSRVSLARAVYQNADVYLLDDPLAAVDSHVAKHIVKEVIGSTGLLKSKTRVMVTHSLQWLFICDLIVVMDQGQIIRQGTFEQLMSSDNGPFTDFLKTHLHENIGDLDVSGGEGAGTIKDNVDDKDSDDVSSPDEDVQYHVDYEDSDDVSSPDEDVQLKPLKRKLFTWKMKKGLQKHIKVKEKEKDELIKKTELQQLIQDEDSQTGQVKSYVLLALFKAFGLPSIVAIFALVLTVNGSGIAGNIWLSRWTDDAFLRNTSLSNTSVYITKTVTYVSIYASMGVLQATTMLFFVGTIKLSMLSASRHLHDNMLNCILRQPMSFFDTTPLGRILNRFSRDVDVVDSILARLFRIFLQQTFSVLSIVFIITYSTPLFLAAVTPMFFIYFFVQKFYIPCSRQLRRLQSSSRSPIYVHFTETISGAASIRAFGVVDRFRHQNEKLVDDNNVYFYAFISASRWLRIRLELLGNFIVLFAALFAVLSDGLSSSLVGLSVAYALQVTTALNMLVQNSTQLESNIVSVERIVEYSTLLCEPTWVVANARPKEGWPQEGAISFRDFSARYRPGLDLVLHSLSADIKGSEKVGIVGRTGSGKSSFSLSLFRLIEAAEGSIIIDDINIADIGLHDLRAHLTILPQDPVLFSGSLRFNLDPLSQFSEERLWQVLEQSYLKTFVMSLPQRLDHQLDECGLNLSVGQRQLVCLARALLRKTRVLVLDEATAAVDMETDELIQRTIRSAFKECTVLTIAHRLHTVLDYDRILLLDCGRLAELDTPGNLLQNSHSLFYKMVQQANVLS